MLQDNIPPVVDLQWQGAGIEGLYKLCAELWRCTLRHTCVEEGKIRMRFKNLVGGIDIFQDFRYKPIPVSPIRE